MQCELLRLYPSRAIQGYAPWGTVSPPIILSEVTALLQSCKVGSSGNFSLINVWLIAEDDVGDVVETKFWAFGFEVVVGLLVVVNSGEGDWDWSLSSVPPPPPTPSFPSCSPKLSEISLMGQQTLKMDIYIYIYIYEIWWIQIKIIIKYI